MMFDLNAGVRPDEVGYFHVQIGQPQVRWSFDLGFIRRTSWWNLEKQDGTLGRFVSWWFLGHLQWYHGSAKIDGTRTRMAWNGELGEPRTTSSQYVVTTKPSELRALRWRRDGPSKPTWDGMGGS